MSQHQVAVETHLSTMLTTTMLSRAELRWCGLKINWVRRSLTLQWNNRGRRRDSLQQQDLRQDPEGHSRCLNEGWRRRLGEDCQQEMQQVRDRSRQQQRRQQHQPGIEPEPGRTPGGGSLELVLQGRKWEIRWTNQSRGLGSGGKRGHRGKQKNLKFLSSSVFQTTNPRNLSAWSQHCFYRTNAKKKKQ